MGRREGRGLVVRRRGFYGPLPDMVHFESENLYAGRSSRTCAIPSCSQGLPGINEIFGVEKGFRQLDLAGQR